jgi:hypothetical protein
VVSMALAEVLTGLQAVFTAEVLPEEVALGAKSLQSSMLNRRARSLPGSSIRVVEDDLWISLFRFELSTDVAVRVYHDESFGADFTGRGSFRTTGRSAVCRLSMHNR